MTSFCYRKIFFHNSLEIQLSKACGLTHKTTIICSLQFFVHSMYCHVVTYILCDALWHMSAIMACWDGHSVVVGDVWYQQVPTSLQISCNIVRTSWDILFGTVGHHGLYHNSHNWDECKYIKWHTGWQRRSVTLFVASQVFD